MRNDERLRTIYEVMAPYIVRNEHNWRDYLAFASQFHKHSFDNILLVYAQDEDVSILATRKQWAAIGRNLIPRAKGVAVCVYRNAKLTLDYLFDVSQTTGKEIHPTDWQLSDEMKKALTERLSYAHGFLKQDFSQALYAMASESVAENYNHFLQELKQETKGHLFTEIPAGGFEAQYIQLLTDCQNRHSILTGQTKGGRLRRSLLPMATVNIRAIFSIVPGYMVKMAFHFSLMKAIPTFPGTGWRFYWMP